MCHFPRNADGNLLQQEGVAWLAPWTPKKKKKMAHGCCARESKSHLQPFFYGQASPMPLTQPESLNTTTTYPIPGWCTDICGLMMTLGCLSRAPLSMIRSLSVNMADENGETPLAPRQLVAAPKLLQGFGPGESELASRPEDAVASHSSFWWLGK